MNSAVLYDTVLNAHKYCCHILTKLENGGPFCLVHSSDGVNSASGLGNAPPDAGGVTTSAPVKFTSFINKVSVYTALARVQTLSC